MDMMSVARPYVIIQSTDNTLLQYLLTLSIWLCVIAAMSSEQLELPGFIKRDEWGALPPKIYPKMVELEHPIHYVVVSFFTPTSDNDKLAVQFAQQKHFDAGLGDIQCNFLIGKNGTIFEGRGWKIKPAKSYEYQDYDGKYLEVTYIGNVNDEPLSNPIYKTTWSLLEFGKKKNYLHEHFTILRDPHKDKNENIPLGNIAPV